MAAQIDHVVVLMLENRSFDCMLGALYPDDPDFEGLKGGEKNIVAGRPFPVWNDQTLTAADVVTPTPDPGEAFVDMNMQLFGNAGRGMAMPADMSGFAQNYMSQPPSKDGPYNPQAVLHYFNPTQVPIISQLAKAFGVSDCWHASAPCQTWPNRFFVHTGTALGHVDNKTFPIPYPAPSLFHRLEECDKTWRIYFHDMPQSSLIRDIWLYALFHFRLFSQFLADAHTGTLPNYSFIEPRYFSDLFLKNIPNDEHPPHNVIYGEQLIANIYNALRSSPCWKQTLFIITYDEHGGCYDHVPPPAAVPPDGNNQYGFDFDSYGVRVPAVLVSPYIPAGSKIRPDSDSLYPFDHTSIISTVRALFDLGGPLTQRDAVAPTLLSALSLDLPTNDGPASIDPGLVTPPVAQVAARAAAPLNGMQSSLAAAAATLPVSPPATPDDVPAPSEVAPSDHDTVATAAANATARTQLFLGVS